MTDVDALRRDPVGLIAPAIRRLQEGRAVTLARAPEGYDAFIVAALTRALAKDGERRAVTLAFVARDSLRAQAFIDALSFAAPEIEALYFPSWDCQPYDRVSPNAAVSAERMTVLARLAKSRGAVERPRILVASVNALTQRAPPLAYLKSAAFSAAPGNSVRMEDLARWLEANGYARASTVRDVGDYASRGGRLDLSWAPLPRCGSISSATRSNRSAPSIRRRSARPRSCARSISCR
jgi:transcription-repair coupling factor (superfamily II helicase)